MRPKRPECEEPQGDLFGRELEDLVNPEHPLVQLAAKIPWGELDERFGKYYVEERGCPGKPTRLMAGLQYLKYTYNLSDEETVARWVENPYWQHFCGERYFQHEWPVHPTSLVRWRKRMGEEGAEGLLGATTEAGLRSKVISPRSYAKVNVDTTVQEKAITYPTDARLYYKMREVLVGMADRAGVVLRQKYPRVAKRHLVRVSRYFHARQGRRGQREVRKLRTLLGRVVRDIERKIAGDSALESFFEAKLGLAERLLRQKREDSRKIYSIHAPEVECISKGKVHKKYEFGNKVGVVVTSREGFVIGVKSFHGNPYDGHTLAASIRQAEGIVGRALSGDVFVDRGYRGHDYRGEATVHMAGKRRVSAALRRWLRRRSAIEAKIADMKLNSRLDRNYLLGVEGDRINAILCGCGVNLRKILGAVRAFFCTWLNWAKKAAQKALRGLVDNTILAVSSFATA
jgi:IS5 family transposase